MCYYLHSRLPQVQQMLYDDVQLIDAWHYALQWLQTEMEKVSIIAFVSDVHVFIQNYSPSVASLR